MSKYFPTWVKLLFGGTLLFGSAAEGCVSDVLRDVADELDDSNDLEDVFDDMEDWFD